MLWRYVAKDCFLWHSRQFLIHCWAYFVCILFEKSVFEQWRRTGFEKFITTSRTPVFVRLEDVRACRCVRTTLFWKLREKRASNRLSVELHFQYFSELSLNEKDKQLVFSKFEHFDLTSVSLSNFPVFSLENYSCL